MKLRSLTGSLFALAMLHSLATPVAAHADADLARLYEQEKTRLDVFEAYFPDLDMARRAAISFHGQLLESDYDAGFLVLELDERDQARLTQSGFTLKPAAAFLARRTAMCSVPTRARVPPLWAWRRIQMARRCSRGDSFSIPRIYRIVAL